MNIMILENLNYKNSSNYSLMSIIQCIILYLYNKWIVQVNNIFSGLRAVVRCNKT